MRLAELYAGCDRNELSFDDLRRPVGPSVDEFVVGGLIVNRGGRVFVQKRSATRKLFPGCWDIVGGHVEHGETLRAALAREVSEETGWALSRIIEPIAIFDWESRQDGRVRRNREFDFIIEVTGDLESPRLEREKVTEFLWVGLESIEILNENRQPGDTVISELVVAALRRSNGSRR